MDKLAILLNNVDRGTIITSLQANDYYRVLKLLNTSVNNWKSICRILENDPNDEIIVLGKFTENALFMMCLPEYKETAERLIALIQKKKHIIFIYKSNIIGLFSYLREPIIENNSFEDIPLEDNDGNTFYYNDTRLESWLRFRNVKENVQEYLELVKHNIKDLQNKLNILPYEKLLDIEISGQLFIENLSEGLIFKIYIPNDRIWSSEFDKFITLFRDYASNVVNKELKVSQQRTDAGTICSLYSVNADVDEIEVSKLYKDFTSFMDMCSSAPDEAREILDKLDISQPAQEKIISKYVKESKRLLLDIKQERELKLIAIKHKLQNELQEAELTAQLNTYINNLIPQAESKNIFLGHQTTIQTQNIYIDSQIINKVNGIVTKELYGDINYSPEEEEILKLIRKYNDSDIQQVSELETSLHELRDNACSNETKRNAWQKLYGFIGKVGDKVGDVGVALLTKYLEQKINL